VSVPVRLLLISNSGRPFLEHCREAIRDFLGPARRVGFVTAAALGDEGAYWERARDALAPVGLTVEHVPWQDGPASLADVQAVFVGGGNTYALLGRLARSGLLAAIRARVQGGVPYVGSSAGANIAGPTILTTNDWNVVGLATFTGLGLVPFNVNPHYLEVDPAMAAGSETRDERIREYHVVNANPVFAIEEGAMIEVTDGVAVVRGRGRVRIFERGAEPRWCNPGERLP
jgi:dipeptidase E